MIAGHEIVAHLVYEENRHEGERKGETRHDLIRVRKGIHSVLECPRHGGRGQSDAKEDDVKPRFSSSLLAKG
jgi:hypothetical protein